ncbi:hypothetical protein POSPLADRAFT_1053544 [Postia placenta MAD-698-R-SB12]|uniref:Uncharacterized protein n=1 Tax=Postia placenta MAD-698-R-SB12 TaxID=670580 RepID=A0A1X6N7X2_9APHY|nr:hypothetical protein POSPLADRAFT_1053544 [Postia placenta MAD-698-R-SB12]OSX64739.1 hypothetical protein POSPLADRAFT_1053544 [Postia placenta MAD-698-R-SB12]
MKLEQEQIGLTHIDHASSTSASQTHNGKQLHLRHASKLVHLDKALVGFFFL